ncbi:PHD finger protein 10-like [Ornithodoros turicata]
MSEDNAWPSTNFAESSDAVEPDSLGSFPSESVAGEDASTAGIFLEPDVPKLSLTTSSTSTSVVSTPKPQETEPIPVFEEDTRSSWNLETIPPPPTTAAKEDQKIDDDDEAGDDAQVTGEEEEVLQPGLESVATTVSSAIPQSTSEGHSSAEPDSLNPTAIDCDSQNSVSSQKSGRKRFSDDEITSEAIARITADKIFEYQWPLEGGDAYILQEQICEFLQVKSFKRKYPDLYRRSVDIDEKKYLREKGVVNETQCDLGLTALRADDVIDLFMKDYPEKYQEYANALRERDKQTNAEKHRGYSAASVEKSKMAEFIRKAVASTAEYNQHLNQERKDERRSCFDMQTFTIQYPTRKIAKVDLNSGARRRYPVALVPGQYQDHYTVYTPQELKYLPLNTVLYGPLQELGSVYTHPGSDGSQSESEDSSGTDGTSCSSSSGGDGSSVSESENVPDLICSICNNSDPLKEKQDLITCSECRKVGHIACLGLQPEMSVALKAYRWHCSDCKKCSVCRSKADEEQMMFCDRCDRASHSFCVGMRGVPIGRWICRLCGQCKNCGVDRPGPGGLRSRWYHEYGKGPVPKERSVSIFCRSCHRRRKGR